MIGELVIHYDDDTYRKHIPVWVDTDEMAAEILDDGNGEYWEPEEPIGNDWGDESFEEIVTDDETWPAVWDYDDDGISHMECEYGIGNFIVMISPE